MTDELKKLGLRVRPRTTSSERRDSDTGERRHDSTLSYAGLSLMEDEPAANVPIRSNPKGLRQGYDPYESGLLAKQEWKPKRNLRELSNWIEGQRKRNARAPEED